MAKAVVFAGPSAQGIVLEQRVHDALEWRGPAKRGDIDATLRRHRKPRTLILCDGIFQSEPAVGHAELCNAIDKGWRVWGVSSIGAIRAFEMRAHGLRGFGYVYQQFLRYADFRDDELCLLHLPEPPYTPVTEALVNLRYALERRGAALGISSRSRDVLIGQLSRLWFGHRSPARIREIMLGPASINPAAADTLLAWMQGHSIKTRDLRRLLTSEVWNH